METRQNSIILRERFEGGLKFALYSNFSNYTAAFLELSDNAISNRILGKPLRVVILASSHKLEISNYGGYGMGLKELREFLQWGKIKSRKLHDIGLYSQGGKSAMGYLGRSMRVLASPLGEKVMLSLEDDNLHDYELKKYRVLTLPTEEKSGFVKIEVGGLKRRIKDEELKETLINTYRPLIENREIIIEYNGERLKATPFPVEQRTNFSFAVKNAPKHFQEVKGWIGYLAPRSGIKGGLRCYKLGRLVHEREFFDHPDASYKQTLNFLFGEVQLDHVPAITNKTDFDRDSIEWGEIRKKMYEILQPFVDELLGRDIQEPTEEEKERIKQARDIVAELMKMHAKNLKGQVTTEETTYGQKPLEPKGKVTPPIHQVGKPKEPRTPPPPDAIGKRRRLKEFMNWEVRPMAENIRSNIEEREGHKLLVINNLYAGYKAAKGTFLYLLETAAIQLAMPEPDERITAAEYVADLDELYAFFCENLESAKENLKKKKMV